MNGEQFDRTSQIESSTLEARAHVVTILNDCGAESLGIAQCHRNHKAALITDALTKGYTLEVRYKQRFNEADARQQENDLLDMYDYAWNERRNGGRRSIRLLPN